MPAKNNDKAVLYTTTHVGDHRADVAGLSAEERGVYESLRTAYLQRGGPLPNNLPELYRLGEAFTSRERTALRQVLDKKFVLTGEGFRSNRCDAEIERVSDLRSKRRAAARSRWDANALQVDEVCISQPINHEPRTSNKEDIATNKAIYPSSSPEGEKKEDITAVDVTGPNGPATATTSTLPSTQPRKGIVGGVITAEYGRELEARLAREAEERAAIQARLCG
jgi:uncharacterized protein YdaU (DUF1376 family)